MMRTSVVSETKFWLFESKGFSSPEQQRIRAAGRTKRKEKALFIDTLVPSEFRLLDFDFKEFGLEFFCLLWIDGADPEKGINL